MTETRLIRVRSGKLSSPISGARVATLGSFDGIHLGHKKVLEHVREQAAIRNLPSALITFDPHPSIALVKIAHLPSITTARQRCDELRNLGIDELIVIRFSADVFVLDYASFIDRYIIDMLDVHHLIIGPDARVGKGAEGTSQQIADHMHSHGRFVEIIKFEDDAHGHKIGSRAIRELLMEGHIQDASALLGRNYRISARVVRGDGRGARIGFPTANLHLRKEVVPVNGVYAGWVHRKGEQLKAVANIGTQPTFSGTSRRVEVHIIEGHHDLYGDRIDFEFVARLRDEQKFSSVEELVGQISKDIQAARDTLSDPGIPRC